MTYVLPFPDKKRIINAEGILRETAKLFYRKLKQNIRKGKIMKKRWMTLLISGVLTASMLSACSLPVNITINVDGQKYSVGTAGDTDAEAPVEDIKLPDDETYESDHGWSVR